MATGSAGRPAAPARPWRPYVDPLEGMLARIRDTAAPVSAPASPVDWPAWHAATLDRLRRALGPFPEPVPLNVEVGEPVEEDGYTRRYLVYDSEAYASVPAWLLAPTGIAPGERRPAVLCAHGHGRGKDDVAGVVSDEDSEEGRHARERMVRMNHDYGRQLAQRGYVCLVPDWRTFGERRAPEGWLRSYNDGCDLLAFGYGYLGFQLLALDLWDAMRGLDVLAQLPYVAPDRLGAAGLSFGGTVSLFLAALDERVRCVVISGYLSTVKDALSHRGRANTCGSQYLPGLLTIGDLATAAGLIAPRPCLVEIGERDQTFFLDDAVAAYEDLARLYAAAGARERLDVDVHPGAHAFSGAKAFGWLDRWLGDNRQLHHGTGGSLWQKDR